MKWFPGDGREMLFLEVIKRCGDSILFVIGLNGI